MPAANKWVAVGKILKEWGVRGQAKCQCYNSDSIVLNQVERVYIQVKPQEPYRDLRIQHCKKHGRFWLLKFKGFETPESLSPLKGMELSIPRELLPKLSRDEYYLTDLIGIEVLSPHHQSLGTIQSFQKVGETETMLVGQSPELGVWVPFHQQFVSETSLERKTVQLTEFGMEFFDL